MLVGERMSYPVISVTPEMPIVDALPLMKREHIRRTPVVDNGKLVGIVSDKDLLNASPSPATSLSIWEMNYLLSKICVRDVMTRNVMTITDDTPIEEAARIMADNKIGGLPVTRDGNLVGMITETDLFKVLLELMGAREHGVRVTALIGNVPGTIAPLTAAIAKQNGNIIAFGEYLGDDPSNRTVTFKVADIDEAKVREAVEPNVIKILDMRTR